MTLVLFNNLTEKDKARAIENLICESTPRQDFFLLVVLSILMATFGLLIDSASVIIGSMLIAPILYPILSLSLGVVIADTKLIARSFYTILKSLTFGIAASAIVTVFFASNFQENSEILARTQPSLIYAAIAIIAGFAASFALIKPHLSETLPGIAISVALMPPLAVTGIGIARFDWYIISNSFLLFLINAAGIIFASMIVFSLMHLYIKRQVASEAIKKELAAVKKELEKAKKEQEKNNKVYEK
ncbi:MAG: hypothetical protein UR69_C0002G0111 [Candidatus Moranbacteria bacterium GW2011_GWE2_35_2-]|nr:MAG: hypothetical protein UR69_C0002G0111 [Candidatus Moranbacteria bacterium GW2011_GWE2_35_2-]KKQ22539.1 MAG: hypothetical protein US37_C0002G0164 [Candidatus Moranbacteria bacterium GW2011_GWF2_37_11]KKQ29608.1 MAG: hypothetical protein US44_C0001G0200 [Candidatus Moranbacteria bacterium GW2011_GWD1_37_17]KKQ30521.1 MAG: hypothetical protein US47_C0002G0111 [Candidatus Moranbacteria bacterium GW2011_GWE1_37_24]KKQ46805.1 MAG: hypothetical protein US66_C0027G0001 [Candidatus Moranbacteria 